MEQTKMYILYKTTCTITGNFYIGVHSTTNLEDGYLGSGKRLSNSIRKHGKENHIREILEFFESREEMMKREREVVNEDLLSEKKCMNLMKGGHGGSQEAEIQSKWWKSANEKRVEKLKTDPEFKKKWSEFTSKRNRRLWEEGKFDSKGENNGFFGKKHTEEFKKRIGDLNRNSQKGERNSQFGKMWITNGVENLFVKKDSVIPPGWTKGRILKKVL